MIRSTPAKLLLGVLTILPLVYIGYFMSVVLRSYGMLLGPEQFHQLFVLHFGFMLLGMGLLVFYVVHLFRTEAIAGDKKVLWLLILIFGNVIAMPVYWFVEIWQAPGTGAASS